MFKKREVHVKLKLKNILC